MREFMHRATCSMRRGSAALFCVVAVLWPPGGLCADQSERMALSEWKHEAPRAEIAPHFALNQHGGRSGHGELVIEQDHEEGQQGWWLATVPVTGGETYAFTVYRHCRGVPHPRRSCVPRIIWLDENGRLVPYDDQVVDYYRAPGSTSLARPEYPLDGETDSSGWTRVSGTYRAPTRAKQARIELHFRWAPGGRVAWSDMDLSPTEPIRPRRVKLAAIHYRPSGKSPAENCREFAPLIARASQQGADLIVLPETLTYYRTKRSYAECAEPVPGPATEYFGELAKRFDTYLVAGLLERDGPRVYNVAVLIGPDGEMVGKYRKVCLPRGEVEGGITPGDDYPVFETRFGKVGMMICYDGFFPEVARELGERGAEVIAWPVWGCNPLLARARACENQLYLVSSTYTDAANHWIVTGIFGPTGELLNHAKEWGSVVITEVDLNRRTLWSGLGDFRAESMRHRPSSR